MARVWYVNFYCHSVNKKPYFGKSCKRIFFPISTFTIIQEMLSLLPPIYIIVLNNPNNKIEQ